MRVKWCQCHKGGSRQLLARETRKEANWEIKGPTAASYFNVPCSELELKDILTRFSLM